MFVVLIRINNCYEIELVLIKDGLKKKKNIQNAHYTLCVVRHYL